MNFRPMSGPAYIAVDCERELGPVKSIVVDGHDYGLVSYPLDKMIEVQDGKGNKLYEAVEDVTGEYMDFFDADSEFILTSPHIGNFESAEDCVIWFLSLGAGA